MDSLKPGELVRVQPFEPKILWKKATSLGNRSYEVELDTGGVFRRNRRHLRKAMEMDTDMTKQSQPEMQSSTVPLPSSVSPHSMVTRYGHLVHQPKHLKDYVCK